MRDNFSIQDWRMNLLTEVENEMPVGNHEIPMKEVGSMKTKTTANPNKGKWRIVGVDSGKPLTDKFYNSKEEAMEASKKLGQIKDSGMKIVQLKDTMKVFTKEAEMPLGAQAGVTDEHEAILKAIQDLVMSGDHKILDLIKDKMEAEWGDAPSGTKRGPWSRNYNDTDDLENANLDDDY